MASFSMISGGPPGETDNHCNGATIVIAAILQVICRMASPLTTGGVLAWHCCRSQINEYVF